MEGRCTAVSGKGVIAAEKPQQCDECGKVDELRPYGPGGRVICNPCMVAHPEWENEARARMAQHIFGEPLPAEYSEPAS